MNPIKAKIWTVARQICILLQEQERTTPAPGKEKVLAAIKRKIAQKQQERKRRIYIYTALSIASSILLLFTVNAILKEEVKKEENLIEFAQRMESGEINIGEEIVLQLANKKEVLIQKKEKVEYLTDGTVKVNQKAVSQPADDSSQKKENAYNQIIVPFGKRTQLHLSDGTEIWVNSGTRVVYPVVFDKTTREIFVDGEVYLNVAHDAAHPFIVKTKQFNVQVLGTSFNVSAYAKERCSVVLVNGSINVKAEKSKEMKLMPGQLADIVNGVAEKPLFTEVDKYISWTDNILLIDNISLKDVFEKLHLYYGKEFISSPQIETIITSGKLELKENFADVMRAITFSVPISYQEAGNKVYLKYDNRENKID